MSIVGAREHKGMAEERKHLTFRVDLPGGQDRLKQAILYVAKQNLTAVRFGLIKLNKIIWRSDFDSFAARGVPVTGRAYKRQKFGPVASEMLPLYSEMLREGLVEVQRVDFGEGVVEKRTIALVDAQTSRFSIDDMRFVDASIAYYWNKTGEEASDDSHGVAWSTRHNGDDMPYESAYLSDETLGLNQRIRLEDRMIKGGWISE